MSQKKEMKKLIEGLKTTDYEKRTSSVIDLTKLLSLKQSDDTIPIAYVLKSITKKLLNDDSISKKDRNHKCLYLLLSLSALVKSDRICEVSEEDSNFQKITTYIKEEILKHLDYIPIYCHLLAELASNVPKSLFKSCILELVECAQKLIDDPTNPDLMLLLLTVKSKRKKSSRILNIPDYFSPDNLENTVHAFASSDQATLNYFVDFMSGADNLDNFSLMWNKLNECLSNDDSMIKLRVFALSISFYCAENSSVFPTVSSKVNILSDHICNQILKLLSSRSLASYHNCLCTMRKLIKDGVTEDDCECEEKCLECFDDENEEDAPLNGDSEAMDVDASDEEESSTESDIDESDEEMKEGDLELLKGRVKSALGAAALDEEDDDAEEDEICFDDDMMFQLDDSLAAIFSSRRPAKDKKKETRYRQLLDSIQKRCLDSVEKILRLGGNIDVFFACLLLLHRVVASSLVRDGLQRRAASIITNQGKNLRPSLVTILKSDQPELNAKLGAFLDSLFQLLRKSGNSSSLLKCFTVVVKLFGAQTSCKEWTVSVMKNHLDSFLINRTSYFTANIFMFIFKKCPQILWECRAIIQSCLDTNQTRPYSRVQALKFVVVLEENKSQLENLDSNDINLFSSNIVKHCITVLQSLNKQKPAETVTENGTHEEKLQPGLIEAVLRALIAALRLSPNNAKLLPDLLLEDLSNLNTTVSKSLRQHLKHCKSALINIQKEPITSSTTTKRKRPSQSHSNPKNNSKKQKIIES